MAFIIGGENMSKFNIGDKVILKNYNRPEGEVVGIDLEDDKNKYLVKSDSLGTSIGWTFEEAKENFDETYYNIIYYEGYAMWTDDIEKIEEDEELKILNQNNFRNKYIIASTEEEHIKAEFNKVKEQKREIVKEMNGTILELKKEIEELETVIEKIKKEWNL